MDPSVDGKTSIEMTSSEMMMSPDSRGSKAPQGWNIPEQPENVINNSNNNNNDLEENFDHNHEDRHQPGIFFRYFMGFHQVLFGLVVSPVLFALALIGFGSLVGIPTGIRIFRSMGCVFRARIDVYQEVGAEKESIFNRNMRIAFLVLFFPLVMIMWLGVLGGLAGTSCLATFFSLLFLPLNPLFWEAKNRKVLKRSFLQAAAVVANSTWSALLISARKGDWDIEEETRKEAPRTPSDWEKRGVFLVFLLVGVALPINDTVSDFLYSQTLLDYHRLELDPHFVPFVVVSFLTALFGLGVTVYSLARIAIGLRQAYYQGPEVFSLYPYFQFDLMEDPTQDKLCEPSFRSHVLRFLGTILEDFIQLLLLYFTSPYVSSSSGVFYFSLVTSVIVISFHWSEPLTTIMTMQAFQRIGHKILFRAATIVIIAILVALPVIIDVLGGINPFCFLSHNYQTDRVIVGRQFDSCPWITELNIINVEEKRIEIYYSKNISLITIVENPHLEFVSFPQLQAANYLNITSNPKLRAISFPKTDLYFHLQYDPVALPISAGFHGIDQFWTWKDVAGLIVVDNPLLEALPPLGNITSLTFTDNPKVTNLGASADPLYQGEINVNIINNAALLSVTFKSHRLPNILIDNNPALSSVTVDFEDSSVSQFPVPTQMIFGVNANLTHIFFPHYTWAKYEVDNLVRLDFGFVGNITFADRVVEFGL